MKRKPPILSLAIAGLALIIAGASIWILLADARAGYAARTTEFTAVPAETDFVAPQLSLSDVQGMKHSLSDYIGKVVLVNLWATWCPPCAAEMPVFQSYYEAHEHEGFVIIGINDGESAADVKSFAATHGLTFTVWLDPTYEATDRAFKTANLPTSYVIDRGGTVKLMWIGAISRSNLEEYVTPLLKE